MTMTKPTLEDLQRMQMDLCTEKGNMKVTARKQLRESMMRLLPILFEQFENVYVLTDEGISFPVAVDKGTGKKAWVHVSFTVNVEAPTTNSGDEN